LLLNVYIIVFKVIKMLQATQQSPQVEGQTPKQIKGAKGKVIAPGEAPNKEGKGGKDEFATILKNIKGIKENLQAHQELVIPSGEQLNLEGAELNISPIINLETDAQTLMQISAAKKNLEGLLKEIKTIAGFKAIKNINDLVEYANKNGLNIQKLDIQTLKASLPNGAVAKVVKPDLELKGDKESKTAKESIDLTKGVKDEITVKKVALDHNIKATKVDTTKQTESTDQSKSTPQLSTIMKDIKKDDNPKIAAELDVVVDEQLKAKKGEIKVDTQAKAEVKTDKVVKTAPQTVTTVDPKTTQPQTQASVQKVVKEAQVADEIVTQEVEQEQIGLQKEATTQTQKSSILEKFEQQLTQNIGAKSTPITANNQNSKNTKTEHNQINVKLNTQKSNILESLLSEIQSNKRSQELQSESKESAKEFTQEIVDNKMVDKNDQVAKRDNLLLRSAQAKETVRNFAQELKEKIDNYKPPVMKLAIELKPLNLGKIDVTLLSRGDSIKVNINSSTTSLNVIMQNLPEFRAALNQAGVNNLDMSFSSNQNSNSTSSGQGEREQQQGTQYSYEEVTSEEELSAQMDEIELTIPRYT
jgi:flagellar hook-length control protein FliK